MHREPSKIERDFLEKHNKNWVDEIESRKGKEDYWKAIFYKDCSDQEYLSSAVLNFYQHCLTPEVVTEIGKPLYRSTAVEIGYGGGRLMLPACSVFQDVFGIDIHTEEPFVDAWLEERLPTTNYDFTNDPKNIEETSVDFVWSYMVFQHFALPCQVEEYFREIKRMLTYRGVASICYGYCFDDYKNTCWINRKENTAGKVSLRLKLSFVEKMLTSIGCRIISHERLPEYPWSPEHKFGQQARVVFKKA